MVSLRQLLLTVGGPVIEVLAAPASLDVTVTDAVLVDPDDTVPTAPGELVLIVGARGQAAASMLRRAARQRASAVGVKVAGQAEAVALRRAAMDAGINLLAIAADTRWERLAALLREVIGSGRASPGSAGSDIVSDLFTVAQTVARLTGGIVSIEDIAHRVLAYSQSSDDVDELRRLSILGRRGPEPYLALLRTWGVYERLRVEGDVVRVEERPELGIRRRLAVGIHAGARLLGTIWVQEGSHPLAENAARTLIGAARTAAPLLIRYLSAPTAYLRLRDSLLASLLEGRVDAKSVADELPADPDQPTAVLCFALDGTERTPLEGADWDLLLRELLGLISVHAAAYRRSALAIRLGVRCYLLLTDLRGGEGTDATLRGLATSVVQAASQHFGLSVRGGIGSVVPELGRAASSRVEADRVLDAIATHPAVTVAAITDVRSQVLVDQVAALLAAEPGLRDPRVTALLGHTELIRSLRAYLDTFGNVGSASRLLHVHPNTLRYRIRRAMTITGIDLADPAQRLFLHLQLHVPADEW